MYVISLPEGKGATAAETYEFRVCEVKSRKSARHYRSPPPQRQKPQSKHQHWRPLRGDVASSGPDQDVAPRAWRDRARWQCWQCCRASATALLLPRSGCCHSSATAPARPLLTAAESAGSHIPRSIIAGTVLSIAIGSWFFAAWWHHGQLWSSGGSRPGSNPALPKPPTTEPAASVLVRPLLLYPPLYYWHMCLPGGQYLLFWGPMAP